MTKTDAPPLPAINVKNRDWVEAFDACFRYVPDSDYYVNQTFTRTGIAMSARAGDQRLYLLFYNDGAWYNISPSTNYISPHTVPLTNNDMIMFLDKYGDYLKRREDELNRKEKKLDEETEAIYSESPNRGRAIKPIENVDQEDIDLGKILFRTVVLVLLALILISFLL